MTLTLRIENESSLPDGGPLSVTIQGQRGIDIGRNSHLDWTLPDPTRFISGKHCEVRYRDGCYWLHDVSTNGTFLNGADHRMQAPHRLSHGDRVVIGNYIVAVALDQEEGSVQPASPGARVAAATRSTHDQGLWQDEREVAPPIDPKQLQAAAARSPNRPDFLDWAADIPDPVQRPSARAAWRDAVARHGSQVTAPDAEPGMDWANGPPSRTPPPPSHAVQAPAPRRPIAPRTSDNPWDDASSIRSPFSSPSPSPGTQRAPIDTATAGAASPQPAGSSNSSEAFLRQLATSAGLPPHHFEGMDSTALAHQLGAILRVVSESMMQLLSARAQAKQLARSATHTMVQAIDNNPLKFAPTASEALRIMLGPPTACYLDGQHAVAQSFDDLKTHQIRTYSAMQHALTMLMADLAPAEIEQTIEDDREIAALLTSRKALLWDAYVARWRAKVRDDNGTPIEEFMLHFADYYDRDGK